MPISLPSVLPEVSIVDANLFANALPTTVLQPINPSVAYQGLQQAQQIQNQFIQQQFQERQFQAQQAEAIYRQQQQERRNQLDMLDRRAKYMEPLTKLEVLAKDSNMLQQKINSLGVFDPNKPLTVDEMYRQQQQVVQLLQDPDVKNALFDKKVYDLSLKEAIDPKNAEFFNDNSDEYLDQLNRFANGLPDTSGNRIDRNNISPIAFWDNKAHQQIQALELEKQRLTNANIIEDNARQARALQLQEDRFDWEKQYKEEQRNLDAAYNERRISADEYSNETARITANANARLTDERIKTERSKQTSNNALANQRNARASEYLKANGGKRPTLAKVRSATNGFGKTIRNRTLLSPTGDNFDPKAAWVKKIEHIPNYDGLTQGYKLTVTSEEKARELTGKPEGWFWSSDPLNEEGYKVEGKDEWVIYGTVEMDGSAAGVMEAYNGWGNTNTNNATSSVQTTPSVAPTINLDQITSTFTFDEATGNYIKDGKSYTPQQYDRYIAFLKQQAQ